MNLEFAPNHKKHSPAEKVLAEVEFPDPDKPKAVISEYGTQRLNQLEETLTTNADNPQIIAIIRCWNKSPEACAELLGKLNAMRNSLPELTGAFVSINSDSDSQNTEANLREAKIPLQIPVVPLGIKGYTWTAGLNGPAAILDRLCENRKIAKEQIIFMPMSFDTALEAAQVEKTRELLRKQRFIFTARKQPNSTSPLGENYVPSEAIKELAGLIRKPLEANFEKILHLFRNTLNLIRLKDLAELGGYNPLCNGKKFFTAKSDSEKPEEISIQGMEDAEFFMRLILACLQKQHPKVLKDLNQALENPILYSDTAWNPAPAKTKSKKLENEVNALKFIFLGMAKSGYKTQADGNKKVLTLENSVIPSEMQDFAFTKPK